MKEAAVSRSLFHLALVAAVCGSLLAGSATAEATCPESLKDRTVEQVVSDLFAALTSQDWELVACHYRRGSFVITDNGVLRGREEIVTGFQATAGIFDDAPWDVSQISTERNTALVLWSIEGSSVSVPDGAATFLVRNGRIVWQTHHGFPAFVPSLLTP